MSKGARQLILATRIARLDVKVLTQNGKLLLLVLAGYADLDGTSCYPDVATMQAETGMGRATLFRALEKLRAIGALIALTTTEEARRRQHAIEYRITVDHLPATPPVERRRVGRPPKPSASSETRFARNHVSNDDRGSFETTSHGERNHVSPDPETTSQPATTLEARDGSQGGSARATPSPGSSPNGARARRMREVLVARELGTAGKAVEDWLTWFESKGMVGMWEAIDAFLRSAKRWARRDADLGNVRSTNLYHRHLSPHWKSWVKDWNAPDAPAAAKAGGA